MVRTLGLVVAVGLGACVGDLIDADPGDVAPPNADALAGCAEGCHGSSSSNAPPGALGGAAATTDPGVGAHQAHLGAAPTWHRAVACADCHVVPETVGAPGHMDGDGTAEVTFGVIAGGASASWAADACTTACHGSAALGGSAPTPIWTQVDGSQATCGSCHGAPPPAPHPADSNCAGCHPTMEEGSLTFRDPSRHIDGVVDFVSGAGGGCTSCHGSATSSAPPTDLDGQTARTSPGVGAHQAHLTASTWRHEIVCANCHVVPDSADSPGHRDGDNLAEVPFDALNAVATYTPATTSCGTMYCHGNGRGDTGTASWLSTTPMACGSCHNVAGTGMSGRHRLHIQEENMTCDECHADVVGPNLNILAAALHIDGLHQVTMVDGTYNPATRACTNTGCHGTETW